MALNVTRQTIGAFSALRHAMTESDLRLIETELGIVLPKEYRRVMLSNPLARYAEPADKIIPTTSLFTDPQNVILTNRELWEMNFDAPRRNFFCFAFDDLTSYF